MPHDVISQAHFGAVWKGASRGTPNGRGAAGEIISSAESTDAISKRLPLLRIVGVSDVANMWLL